MNSFRRISGCLGSSAKRVAVAMPGLLAVLLSLSAGAQVNGTPYVLGSNCTATMLNRSVQLNDDGTFAIPNVPYNLGNFRVKIFCTNSDGTTSGALSGFVTLTPNGFAVIDRVDLGAVPATATNLVTIADVMTIGTRGATSQINVSAFYADGSYLDVTTDPGTTYTVSNPAIATISPTGVLTANGAGVVTITTRYDGLVGSTSLNISANLDSDGDGIPDEWEIAHGLNPYDPSDASADPDNDGLTNLQEYQLGTDPHVADTDGDGLSDGQEVKLGTNPLVADTDGDGLSDGQEVLLGTNPLVADTDGDGIPDGLEVKLKLNPLVADPTTTVTGQVIDPAGKPVAGASATVLGYFTGTTDLTGTFTIPFVPTDVPGAGTTLTASVIAVVSGGGVENGSSTAVPSVPAGTTNLGVIQLGISTGVVTGLVVGPTQKIVAGAVVTVSGTGVTLTVTTDATGTYRVTNLPGGTVLVSAVDPTTGLRGQVTGMLAPQSTVPLTLGLTLGGFGSVAGTVTNATGTPVANGTTVSLSGSTVATATTGALGAYTFAFVPLGAFAVSATDTKGNTGSASGFNATTSQTVTANIQFQGSGTVTGTVTDASGNPAPNAAITLMASNSTQQMLTTATDASGHYTLNNVFVGAFAVSASLATNNLGGTTLGIMGQQGQTVTVNVTLAAAGTVAGTVVQADGTTPAVGVKVQAGQNAIMATSDAAGLYQLNFVPPGNVQLLAKDPATGNQGTVNTTSTAATTTTAPNLVLNGLGTVVVTVLDASNVPVPMAQLMLTSDTAFTQQLSGLSAADGTFTFQNALAGTFTVTAMNPANQLAGTAQGTLTVGGSAAVTVMLQPAGTVSGTVFAADGQTPAPGVEVQLDSAMTTVSASDGTYAFTTVPSGTHSVVALDGVGSATSLSVTATITGQGQVATANLVLIARGVVTGTVTNIDGTPAIAASVSVKGLTAGFARSFAAQTDASGNYSVGDVPTGPVEVSVYTLAASAQVAATLPAATGTVTVNLMLSQDLTASTRTLFDADAMPYDLDQTGEISSGLNSVFAGLGLAGNDQHDETLTLTLDNDGSQHGFSGNPLATLLQNGQEVAIEQDGVAGLNVVRRVFVPSSGYMARYLEVLTNPTAADITVDVNLASAYRYTHEDRNGYTYSGTPEINGSSSGDTTFAITTDPTTTDHWIIEGTDEDTDPFLVTANVPSVAYVFDDGKGTISLGSGSFALTNKYGQLNAAWKQVRVPAGQTVELMHFVSQEVLRTAATAAAQRLIQLPPEALMGLSAADALAIKNFAVPTNLTSAIAVLPAVTGGVGGSVYAGDTTTPVPAAIVSLQSTDPIFARTYQYRAGPNGIFQFTGNPDGQSDAVAVPLESYTLSAVHPLTGVIAPVFTGLLNTAAPTVDQAVVFSNTGQVQGTVRLNATTVVTNGTLTFTSPSLTGTVTIPILADGTYSINGLPAGTYAEVASITGTLLTGLASPLVTAGMTTNQDVMIGSSGAIQGTVRGADTAHTPLPGITVYLHMGAQTVSALTNSSGMYSFTDVPGGTYMLQAYDPASNTAATVTAVVTGSATTTQDIVLASGGSVVVQAAGPAGVVLSGLTATLRVTTSSGVQSFTAVTNASGAASFSNVAVGQLSVEVDAANGYSGTTTGTLGLSGQSVTLNVTLTQSGTISGTVFYSDGKTPLVGGTMQLYGLAAGSYIESLIATTQTDASGHYTFRAVPVGSFTVAVQNQATGDQASAVGTIAASSQQLTVNLSLDGVGTVNVTVVTANGSPDVGVGVQATSSFNPSVNYKGTTGAQGTVALSNVLAGQVTVTAVDPTTLLTGQGTVTLASGATQSLTITLQPSGKIAGHIYMPDGTTPAGGAMLQLYLYGASSPAARHTSLADGSYTFTNVALGTYVINVYDTNQVLRNYANNLALTASGQVITQDITYLGVGTVNGTVSNTDGSAAAYIGVELVSQGRLALTPSTTADANGNYSITAVPAGPFQVTAEDLSKGVIGTATGAITTDGDIETVNIQLSSNVVSLTQTFTDFNGFTYDVQRDGTIGNGTLRSYLLPDDYFSPEYQNAFHLAVVQSGISTDFTGSATGTTSIGGRQVAIAQNIDALNVTRKVYVPSTGYFARYLEVLANPGTSPVTVDVQVSGGVQYTYNGNPITVATSSGDASLSAADQTLVTNDDDGTNPWPYTQPALGEAFEGPGAAVAVAPTYTLPTSANGLNYPALLYQWNAVTIPAGGQVAFLHFATQQTNQGQAVASVARLDQLPPEGLTGLLPAELSAIQNFVVPQGGTSALQALVVPTAGSVTGVDLAGDGKTPVAGAFTVLSGTDLYLGATTFQLADSKGTFDFTSAPVAGYTLQATDLTSYVRSPFAPGSFAAGVSNSSTNVVFSNAGLVMGSLNVPSGTLYNSAVATISQTGTNVASVNADATGSFDFTSILPGSYTLFVSAVPPLGSSQGTSLNVQQTVAVTAGQATQLVVNLPVTGTVNGVFTNAAGAVEVGASLNLSGANNFIRVDLTDSTGTFSLPQVPVGTYTITATDPGNGLIATATINVTGGALTQNLQLPAGATLNVAVTFANGSPAPNALVTINRSTDAGNSYPAAGVTAADGTLAVTQVPVGAYTLVVYYPGQTQFQQGTISVTTMGSVATNGQTIAVPVVFPATGVVTGQVTTYSGAAAPGAVVYLDYNYANIQTPTESSVTTNGSGAYTFNPVVSGQSIELLAQPNATAYYPSEVTVSSPASGTTLTKNLVLPVNATVVVTAVDANNNPLPQTFIDISGTQPTTAQSSYYVGMEAGSDGSATFLTVPDASYFVELQDNTNTLIGSSTFVVHTTDDGKTIRLTVQSGFMGTVAGTLVAADGATPAPPATYQVNLLDTDTQMNLATVTSMDGTFNFPDLTVGRDGYTVQAQLTQSPTTTYYQPAAVSKTGSFTAQGQTQNVLVTLPIPVLEGTIYQSDGTTPVANPNVIVTVPNEGTPVTFYGVSNAQGGYTVAVPAQDTASVIANANGLTTQAQYYVHTTDTVDRQDVVLHASGTVSGVATDQDGNTLGNVQVSVASAGSTYTLFTQTGYDGTYSIPYVATGALTVTATYYQGCSGTATGTLANAGDTATVNVAVNTAACAANGSSSLHFPRLLPPSLGTPSASLFQDMPTGSPAARLGPLVRSTHAAPVWPIPVSVSVCAVDWLRRSGAAGLPCGIPKSSQAGQVSLLRRPLL